MPTVRDSIETVARTQDLHALPALHKFTNLLDRPSRIQIFCSIFNISGPVFQLVGRRPSKQRGERGAGHRSRPQLDEGTLVHRSNRRLPAPLTRGAMEYSPEWRSA